MRPRSVRSRRCDCEPRPQARTPGKLREREAKLREVGVGERNQSLLDAAKVERGFMFPHRFLQTCNIAVNIAIKQFEEHAEIFRVALVRCRGHQQVMVGHLGEFGPQVISERRFITAGGAHFVRLIHDD